MPNLRGKTWTTTTPANVEDAQFWEDHLVGEGVIEGMQSTLTEVDALKHWHNNKATLDELSEDADGDLNFKGEKIKGGGGISNAFAHVTVGSETIDAEGADSFELVAGSNVTMTVEENQIIINSAGGGGESGGDMYKSEFVLPGGTGKVLAAKSADNAAAVGNADTEVLEGLSDNAGNLNYKGQPIGGGGQGGSVVYVSTTSFKGYPVTITITDRVTGVTETKESVFDSKGKASFNIISVGTAVITVMDGTTPYTSTVEITCYSVYQAPDIDRFRSSIIVTARCGTSYVSGAEVILNGSPTGVTTDDSGIATVPVGATGSYTVEIRKDGTISDNKSTVNITSESSKTCSVYIARIKYEFDGNLEARVTGGTFAKDINATGPSVYVYVPKQQVYTLTGTLNGNDVTVKANVSSYDEVTVSVVSATINVTTEAGAVVTATSGIDSYSATAEDGVANIKVGKPGTYTITATIDDITSEDVKAVIINDSGETKETNIAFAKIKLVFDGILIADVTKNAFIHNINTSVSPYTVIVPSIGNYNLSGTLDGKEVIYDIEIADYAEKEIEIKAGYSYVDWLNAANMSDTFGSLESLLEDEKAIRELMTKHSSVNLLVEWCAGDEAIANQILSNDLCAKWINLRDYALDTLWANETVKSIMDVIDKYGYGEWALVDGTWQPKGNVPVMTSNNAPYGEIYAGCNSSSAPSAYIVFDGNDITSWDNYQGSAYGESWWCYKFTNPIKVNGIRLIEGGGSDVKMHMCSVQYSNDGVNWENAYTFDDSNNAKSERYEKFDNEEYALYWRVHADTSLDNKKVIMASIQFYGRELKVSVPTMTSNTEPWGEVIHFGDIYPSNSEAYKAFDENTSTYSANRGNVGFWLGYDFKKHVCIKQARITTYSNYLSKNKNVLEKRVDGVWTQIADLSSMQSGEHENIFDVNSECDAIRIYADSADYDTFSKVNFYGVDYSEREFEEGSTMHYIYDHGVELEETGISLSTGGIFTKTPQSLLLTKNNTTASQTVGVYASTKNKINLDGYKFVKAHVLQGISPIGCTLLLLENYPMTNYMNKAYVDVYGVPLAYLNISSFKEELYLGFGTAWNSYTGNQEVDEWWLE